MRITTGQKKGLSLLSPQGTDVRPTSDRVKQSIFNMLCSHLERSQLEDIAFLDLFAGSGAIGIEALSRGAKRCVFVDNNREAVSVIKKNLEKAGFSDRAEVFCADAFSALLTLANKKESFDIIFFDPPYTLYDFYDCAKAVASVVSKHSLLTEAGFIIAEHGQACNLSETECISAFKRKSYGKTTGVTFFVPCRR